jgi:D-3-phosphoglycerate dehydrogenase
MAGDMRVAFTDFVYPNLDLEERILAEAGMALLAADPQCSSEEDVIRAAEGAGAIVIQVAPVTRAVLEALPDLRIISCPSIGVDTVDLAAARELGIWVANVPDANITEVATHTVAMALSLIRGLPAFDRSVREGRWDYEAAGPLRRPGTLTLGVVGQGRIGRLTASYAAPLFGRTLGYDPHLPAEAWPAGLERMDDLRALFRESDLVTLHLPLTPESRGMVGRELLAEMKPGSYLVNVSRGPIVEIPALLEALDSGHLAGAALDVLPDEPPAPDDPALHHPKVILSPHSAFYSLEADEELRRRSATNIVDLVRKGRPPDVVVEGTR